ncbi:UNKNOWN [Stylonychia lemnae]|uniref:Uncharacterized protein n=1 Tax=Stylonychia lemnae TaxID=5949 RepID=A0A077ZSL1_STYLE|nr:UNKNOWN [Stylonychia lemnae]|eukprot:CDW72868.1 UNKNOWN [Stylonychia lemnae]
MRQMLSQKLSEKFFEVQSDQHIGSAKSNKRRSMKFSSQFETEDQKPPKNALDVIDNGTLEVCEELVEQKRYELYAQQQRVLHSEREHQDKIIEKQRNQIELEQLNKSIENKNYTFDYNGNLLMQKNVDIGETQNYEVSIKFKFKNKRVAMSRNKKERPSKVPFEENQLTGTLASDYNKLAKLVQQKQFIINTINAAGSMFDHFKDPKAGIKIVEKDKEKCSSREFDSLPGRISKRKYQQRTQEGNFVSSNAYPDVYEYIKSQDGQNLLLSDPHNGQDNIITSLKSDVMIRIEDANHKSKYMEEAKFQFKKDHNHENQDSTLSFNHNNDNHQVIITSPQSISDLINVKKSRNYQNPTAFFGNQTTSDVQSGDAETQIFSEIIPKFKTIKGAKLNKANINQTIGDSIRDKLRQNLLKVGSDYMQAERTQITTPNHNLRIREPLKMNPLSPLNHHPVIRPFSRGASYNNAIPDHSQSQRTLKSHKRNIFIPALKQQLDTSDTLLSTQASNNKLLSNRQPKTEGSSININNLIQSTSLKNFTQIKSGQGSVSTSLNRNSSNDSRGVGKGGPKDVRKINLSKTTRYSQMAEIQNEYGIKVRHSEKIRH